MRESSIDFSPYKKTHRPTPSQQSNTLSDISCDTQASDILESEASETEAAGEAHENRYDFVYKVAEELQSLLIPCTMFIHNMHLFKFPDCSSCIDFL